MSPDASAILLGDLPCPSILSQSAPASTSGFSGKRPHARHRRHRPWNTVYLERAVAALAANGHNIDEELLHTAAWLETHQPSLEFSLILSRFGLTSEVL